MRIYPGAQPLYERVLTGAVSSRGVRLIGRGLWYISSAHTVEDIGQAVAREG